MNLERIQHLIKNPNFSESDDIHSLKELTIKYPYSQLFSILYLKALNTNKDIRFDEELNKFAYKISDRQKLYDLIYDFSKNTTISNGEVKQDENINHIEKISDIKDVESKNLGDNEINLTEKIILEIDSENNEHFFDVLDIESKENENLEENKVENDLQIIPNKENLSDSTKIQNVSGQIF